MDPVISTILVSALSTAIPALITWGITLLKKYVEGQTQNAAVNTALTQATDLVESVVGKLNQTVVPYYKNANADGKLSDIEKDALKKMAYTQVMNQLPGATQQILSTAVNSLKEYIETKIESSVYMQK